MEGHFMAVLYWDELSIFYSTPFEIIQSDGWLHGVIVASLAMMS